MHNLIRTAVRFILVLALASTPYIVLPKVSGFYIWAGECAVAMLFIMIRFREPKKN